MNTTHAELQTIAEFDHPFTVAIDGALLDAVGVYAPEVYHSETDDVEVSDPRWTALTGYTGQHAYSGAVMHASEYLGGGLARDILATPGTYVVTSVGVHDEEPAGWAVLRLSDHS